MLRELATLLQDIHTGIAGMTRVDPRGHLTVRELAVNIPVDMVAIFKDGGCTLLTDVARTASDASWYQRRSQLRVIWHAQADWENEP